jgi:hypothetical protein
LSPPFLLMEDRSHTEIMFCGTEGIFNFGKLDVGVPQELRIGFLPVGTEDVAASGFQCPLVAFIIFLDVYGEMVIFFSHSDGEERRGTAVAFQKATDLPLHFLFISDCARIGPYRPA